MTRSACLASLSVAALLAIAAGSAFAAEIGLAPEEHGAWVRRLGDIALVGLDSCTPPRTLLSASGMVTQPQLDCGPADSAGTVADRPRKGFCLSCHSL